jgi:muramoyltetrapeptide carboxypeptidase
MSTIETRPLAPGARVALLAPAGPLGSTAELERSEANARAFGWEPVTFPHALSRDGYLAGDDTDRLADLEAALRDPRTDAVWCVRGGYGTMRLLDSIDYDALRRRPKPIIGYSDITALHLAVRARADIVSYHGPNARGVLTPFSRESLARAVASHDDPLTTVRPTRWLRDGRAEGHLEGGNLALICALLGTPYAPRFDGAILVIEDVGEPLYRIDRMFRQLMLSGALARVAALCFGAFTERGDDADALPRTLDVILEEAAAQVHGPCIADVPLGHIADQWTLPLGARAELSATSGLALAGR